MQKALLREIAMGQELIPVVKHISLAKVQAFAVMSQGAGPIHVDQEYCALTPFKKPLVPGFMIAAYVGEMLENNFGWDWFNSGELELSFVKPAVPGDSLLVQGKITHVQARQIICELFVLNQKNDKVAKGTAQLLLGD